MSQTIWKAFRVADLTWEKQGERSLALNIVDDFGGEKNEFKSPEEAEKMIRKYQEQGKAQKGRYVVHAFLQIT